MICSECREEREIDDFLMGELKCYKCVYKCKMAVVESMKTKKKLNACKICGNAVKPPKTAFCSDKCADIGWENQRKEYWVRKVFNINTRFNP